MEKPWKTCILCTWKSSIMIDDMFPVAYHSPFSCCNNCQSVSWGVLWNLVVGMTGPGVVGFALLNVATRRIKQCGESRVSPHDDGAEQGRKQRKIFDLPRLTLSSFNKQCYLDMVSMLCNLLRSLMFTVPVPDHVDVLFDVITSCLLMRNVSK